jgi:chromosome segregation ATPase
MSNTYTIISEAPVTIVVPKQSADKSIVSDLEDTIEMLCSDLSEQESDLTEAVCYIAELEDKLAESNQLIQQKDFLFKRLGEIRTGLVDERGKLEDKVIKKDKTIRHNEFLISHQKDMIDDLHIRLDRALDYVRELETIRFIN